MKSKWGIILIILLGFYNSADAIEIKINDTRKDNFYIEALNFVMCKSGNKYKIIIEENKNYPNRER